MTSEPDDEDMRYADTVMKIFAICKDDLPNSKLCVFVAVRKDNGKKAYVLGHASHLDGDGEPTPETKYQALAEFLPHSTTQELYDVKDFFIPKIIKKEPLPDNVVEFRRKK